MKAYCVIAAALAAFAMGTLQVTPSIACTEDKCPGTMAAGAGKPLQLTGKKPSARAATKESRRKRARAPKKAPIEEPAPAAAAAEAAPSASGDTPLPVVVVRTTRESGDEQDADVVSPTEFNDVDRAAASSPSLLTSTIAKYLGRPDLAEDFNDGPQVNQVNTDEFPAEVKEAFAADPEPQRPAEIALEYVLMTFGGALAAASAIRLFAV
jgi:hypothetical protein